MTTSREAPEPEALATGDSGVPSEARRLSVSAFWPHRVEDWIVVVALAAMAILPLAEILLRRLGTSGIPGSIPFVQHLTLWVGFLGGAIAARENRLLALATGTMLPEGRVRRVAAVVTATVAAVVSGMLLVGAAELVRLERQMGGVIAAGVRTWVGQLALPVAFGLIALRLIGHSSRRWGIRLLPLAGLVFGVWLAGWMPPLSTRLTWPGLVAVLVAAALGAPIFTVLGGAAAVLFLAAEIPTGAILVETYRLAVSPTLPALPLFTLAGFLLAEGRASERLLRMFRAWVGWVPGGTAIVCVALSAFFTVFTGGSGVTILALGGLLLPALLKDGYPERFSLGLLTSSGSLGLLFPPALPLILYAIVAQIPIEDLFIGGMLPGIVLLLSMAALGFRAGLHLPGSRHRFEWREALAASWAGKWELLLPVVVLASFLGGHATLVESSALAALYAFVTQTFVHRDISIRRDMRRVFTECAVTIGGVLVILGVAVGFTNYLVDAQVPARLLDWTQSHIRSQVVFLLGLNLFLLVVGCLMDIYSATFVVVPLIVPIGLAFGVHPVHLGVVFIANLELGYLTPPVGLNLFLASYRFKRPMMEVTRAALPMLAVRAVAVLFITYVPWLTTGLLQAMGR
jgi:tripartite ATP-independent transporter DctM subunit